MITLQKATVDSALLDFCLANPNVAKALRLFDRDGKDWVGMARILELICADVGGLPEIVKGGWATRKQLELFFHTANTAGDAARDGASVVLAVQNIGPPIAPEALPFIFDLLVRGAVKESEDKGRTGGLGLGLYIARHIALAHGGSISAESSSEAGTTFTVTLPRKSRLDERTGGAQADDGGTASRRATRASRSSGFDST